MAGLGHAVWCARHLIGDEPFAVLLPDELLWNAANPCLKQMVAGFDDKGGNVVAVVEVPEDHVNRYGIVDPGTAAGRLTEVRGMIEKPAVGAAPSRLAIVGRYILQPEVLDHLSAHQKGAGGEIQLTDAMAQLIGNQPFHGFTFDGQRYDCGDKAGYIQANLAIALAREDIGSVVREFATSLLAR